MFVNIFITKWGKKMSVAIKYKGRYFNNVFQYVFARLIAYKNGLKLTTPWIDSSIIKFTTVEAGAINNSQQANFVKCECLTKLMKNTYGKITRFHYDIALRLQGENHVKILDTIALINEQQEGFCNNDWLIENMYSDKAIVCDGFFQKASFYDDNVDLVKSWFVLPRISEKDKHINDVVLHFRLDDYINENKCPVISPEWYKQIIDKYNLSDNKIYGVVEKPKQQWEFEYIDKVKLLIPEIVIDYRSAKDDWNFIRSFGTIICSNSSFCWWAAWLSEARQIFTFKKWLAACPNAELAESQRFTTVEGKYLREV